MADKLKILIVEDSKSILALYNAGFADEVFDKRLVDNGSEALEVYRTWQPDIIVLDIMLPGMSGYAVLKEIREKIEDKATTIIMVTSMSSKDDIMDCVKLGVHGYIVKPFTHKEIADKILEYYKKTDPERAKAAQLQHKKALEEMKKRKAMEKIDEKNAPKETNKENVESKTTVSSVNQDSPHQDT